jgi:hypothetical protein
MEMQWTERKELAIWDDWTRPIVFEVHRALISRSLPPSSPCQDNTIFLCHFATVHLSAARRIIYSDFRLWEDESLCVVSHRRVSCFILSCSWTWFQRRSIGSWCLRSPWFEPLVDFTSICSASLSLHRVASILTVIGFECRMIVSYYVSWITNNHCLIVLAKRISPFCDCEHLVASRDEWNDAYFWICVCVSCV